MKVSEITTHTAEALALLLEQFKSKTNIESLLTSYVQEIQDLETALYALWDERTLDAAVGEQLDVYGRIVDQSRNTDIDEDYRKYIKGRIAANYSKGRIPELVNILELISDDGFEFYLTERYPASFYIEGQDAVVENSIAAFDDATYTNASADRAMIYPAPTGTTIPTFVAIAIDLLNDARGAGIDMNYLWSYRDSTETFTLSSASGAIETSSLLGLADAAQSTGGYLQGVTE